MEKLERFNFWSQKVDYCNREGTTCTSDQGGSQDGGGGSCNADGTGGSWGDAGNDQ